MFPSWNNKQRRSWGHELWAHLVSWIPRFPSGSRGARRTLVGQQNPLLEQAASSCRHGSGGGGGGGGVTHPVPTGAPRSLHLAVVPWLTLSGTKEPSENRQQQSGTTGTREESRGHRGAVCLPHSQTVSTEGGPRCSYTAHRLMWFHYPRIRRTGSRPVPY